MPWSKSALPGQETDSTVDENFKFGTLPEMVMALGDPDCDWDDETRLIAAGHILTDWQESNVMVGLYEQVRHAVGSTDERTIHDLGPDDVFEVCRGLWLGVQEGRFVDPRHPSVKPGNLVLLSGDEFAPERAERFNELAAGMHDRLILGGFVTTDSPTPAAKPDLYVLASGLCLNSALFLDDIHAGDAEILRRANEVFMRLYDYSCEVEESRAEGEN